jgi:hypothetical protein
MILVGMSSNLRYEKYFLKYMYVISSFIHLIA